MRFHWTFEIDPMEARELLKTFKDLEVNKGDKTTPRTGQDRRKTDRREHQVPTETVERRRREEALDEVRAGDTNEVPDSEIP